MKRRTCCVFGPPKTLSNKTQPFNDPTKMLYAQAVRRLHRQNNRRPILNSLLETGYRKVNLA